MATIDVEKVLEQLTDREKISLLAGVDFWHTKSIPNHGIPSLRLSDGPGGVRGTKFFNSIPAACVPCGTALGATFDRELIRETGHLLGDEAKAEGVHVWLGPTVNIQRSPLGGRGFGSFGEDPVLAGLAAASIIDGVQSRGVVACLKHFVCNDQEHERNKLAIRDSHPKAVMSAYNKVNGIHVCEDERFLREILREEWGWNGLVMSDWFGTYSTSEAINAGMDLEMPGPSRWRGEQAFVAASSDKSRPTALDDCARRVLNLVNECVRSGIPENAPELARDTPETTEFLRRLAAESIVLLKNDGGILPLKSHKKTLVVGPNARLARYCGGGSSELIPYHAVSPLEGIQEKIGAENVTFTIGAHSHKDLPDIARLLIPTLDSTENGVTFTPFNDAPGVKDRKPVEELLVRTSSMILLDYNNPKLAQLWYADIEGYLAADRTGEFQFGLCVFGAARLYVNGTLLIDATEVQKPGNAFFGCGTEEVKATLPLQKGDTYHVKVEFFSEPFSKLTPQAVTFPNGAVKVGGAWVINHQEEIRCAAALAREHEQVVLCIGLNNGWESEGFDRDDMKLPPYLDDLAAAVLEANPNTAVVVQSGAPVEMPWLSSTSALLQAWYGGNEAGHGIADVLYGDVNPSGKLSLSFPKKIEDNPAYFNFRCEAGRVLYGEDVYVGYRWYEGLKRPVNFPFGFGLSYTTFKFEDLSLKMDNESLTISVRVSNTGNVDGAQVLQIYVSHKNPSIRRPVKELKEFSKVFLTKGTNKTISLDIPLKYACSYFDERRDQWIFEKGQYTVIVSDSSRLETGKYVEADFKIDKTIWWSGM